MTKTRRPQKDRNGPLVFGYIGVVDPVKGIYHPVEAFEPLTTAELCIYGGETDYAPYPDRTQFLAQLHRSPHIRMMGRYEYRDDGRILGEVDIVVVPSIWYENALLVIREAFLAKKPVVTAQQAPGSEGVLAAFNGLLNGIRHASVAEVTSAYWNSPRLSLFNYNGTVTKGWDQVKKIRESAYPEIKDVKLDVRDVAVTMLGRDAALVSCQWTQTQTYKGAPETASGRMTLVFRRIGTAWKAIHLHSSPDSPNPASIPPSEQVEKPSPVPTPNP